MALAAPMALGPTPAAAEDFHDTEFEYESGTVTRTFVNNAGRSVTCHLYAYSHLIWEPDEKLHAQQSNAEDGCGGYHRGEAVWVDRDTGQNKQAFGAANDGVTFGAGGVRPEGALTVTQSIRFADCDREANTTCDLTITTVQEDARTAPK